MSTPRKFAIGSRTDPGWKHGDDVRGDGRRVLCDYCKDTFSGIYRFKHHLAGTGKDAISCTKVSNNVKTFFESLVSENYGSSNKRRKRSRDIYDVGYDSGEKPTTAYSFPITKKCEKFALGDRSDPGWDHGKDVNLDGRRVRCNYCKATFGGIYRLKKHLACTGKDARSCTKVPNNVKTFFESLLSNKRKRGNVEKSNTAYSFPIKTKSKKLARGHRSDPGWDHGKDVNLDGRSVRCNYCKDTFGGIYRLKNHLAGTGKDAKSCTKVPNNVKVLFESLLSNKCFSLTKRKRTISDNANNVSNLNEASGRKLKRRKNIEILPVSEMKGLHAHNYSKPNTRAKSGLSKPQPICNETGDASGAENNYHNCETDLIETHLPVATVTQLRDQSATSNPSDSIFSMGFDSTRFVASITTTLVDNNFISVGQKKLININFFPNTPNGDSTPSLHNFDLGRPLERLIDAVSSGISLNTLEPITPNQSEKTKNSLNQTTDKQLAKDSSSVFVSTQVDGNHKPDSNQQKTPQSKQKRKKHRPKVVREGQKSGKISAVSSEKNETPQRKYGRNNGVDKTPEIKSGEVASKRNSRERKSCKKRLNFDENRSAIEKSSSCRPAPNENAKSQAPNENAELKSPDENAESQAASPCGDLQIYRSGHPSHVRVEIKVAKTCKRTGNNRRKKTGNRRFTPWKGSVIDSVVGVFLTQNVSDHASSSAFMSMAAHFPIKTDRSFEPCFKEMNKSVKEQKVQKSSVTNHRLTPGTNVFPSDLKKGNTGKKKKIPVEKNGKKKNIPVDWDALRLMAQKNGKRERTVDTMDILDWEAVWRADVEEVASTIKDRGMHNVLAERIQAFLDRLVTDHGSIDLEWLRDVPPDIAKEYLLSFKGLGLKSTECVRLLTLHHRAFPVDTNVARIAVRLGWVPLQPLPESLQLHLLELYPVMESIQRYLWPRLCKFDQRTLYELHYQLITFGKVFCTKSKPNCNACPMRGECRHFASAFASARLTLPCPEEKRIIKTQNQQPKQSPCETVERLKLPEPQPLKLLKQAEFHTCEPTVQIPTTPIADEPIIEVPGTPESEIQVPESDIEDVFPEDPEEIPTIQFSFEEFANTLQNYMEGDMSKALVALPQEAASIPVPKLKNANQLRTEHHVYELPNSHPLLKGLDKREPDDPCPYLLAIWTPGETANSIEQPESRCSSQDSGNHCELETCFSCNSIREANSQTVRGTLLIPCRTATRASFPLNGTYFQVNEVFADHESSLKPMDVCRSSIWNLPRRTVYFGTSIPTIFKGLSTERIQHCFWKGSVCVRGFDRKTKAPRPLLARLHFPASRLPKASDKTDEKKNQHSSSN